MPTFDIVSEVDKTEVKNAVEQTNKEVSTRFDFKGSDARITQAELVLTVHADNEFQLDQVQDILNGKLTKRGVDIKCLEISEKIEKVSGNKVKRDCTVKTGVEIELAKKIVKIAGSGKVTFAEFTQERKEVEPGDYYTDISKIKRLVGWEPKTDLEEGLRRTIEFYRKHKKEYWE